METREACMVVVLVSAALCGCDRGESATPPPPPQTAGPLTRPTTAKAAMAPRMPDATGNAATEEDGTPACEKPLRVSPRALAASWPTMVGKRVSFVGAIRRSLGFGEALVTAGGARFDVMLSPSDVWTGTARHTYQVMGSSTVRLGGPTRLPQLLLDDGDCR